MITLLIVAAAAMVGWTMWRRRAAVPAPSVPVPTVQPNQLAPQAVVANAFSDLLNIGTNSLAQWFRERVNPKPGEAVPYKPPPLASKGPTISVPAGSTPNLQTTPIYA